MIGISQSILLIGICLVVFGVASRPSAESSQASEGFLSALLAALNKNSSKKDAEAVDFVRLHSTHR
jgi:hypothetical protein